MVGTEGAEKAVVVVFVPVAEEGGAKRRAGFAPVRCLHGERKFSVNTALLQGQPLWQQE